MTVADLSDTARTGDTTALQKKPEGLGARGQYHITGGYGQFPKANTGFYLNHRSKRLDFVATSYYSFNKSYSLITSRDGSCQFPIDLSKGVRTYQHDQEFRPTTNYIYTGLSLDYEADKNTVVGISTSMNGTFRRLLGYTNTVVNIYGDSVLNQIIQNDGRENLITLFTEVNIDKTLSKNKKLGINAAYIRRSDHCLPEDHYTFLNGEGADVSNTSATFYTQQNTLTRKVIDIFSGKAEYTQKLDARLYLKTGLSFSNSKLVSTVNAEGLKDDTWIGDYGLSDKVTLQEPMGDLYSSLHFDDGKYGFDLGLAYKYVTRDLHDGDSSGNFPGRYGQFLPSLTVRKKLSSQALFIIEYHRRFKLPGYGDIASNLTVTDIYGVSIGNPFLLPVVSNDISAGLHYKDFRFSIVGRRNEKAIVAAQQSESPMGNMFYIMSQNLTYSESVSVDVNLPFQLAPWLKWSSDLEGAWNQFRADPKPLETFVTSVLQRNYFNCHLKSTVSVKLPYQFFVEVSGSYHSSGWYGSYNGQASGGVGLVINKRLRDNSALQLSVSDLFRSMYLHQYLNAPELAYHIRSDISFISESKQAELVMITWRKNFGSDKIKQARAWDLTSEDLQNR